MARQRELMNMLHAIEKAEANFEKIKKETPIKLKEKIDAKAHAIIEDWYNDYPPHGYKRRQFDLYNAYKITISGIDVEVSFGAEFMEKSHHQDNEIIYNNAFLEGYHGGSRGIDQHGEDAGAIPRWRIPMPSKGVENPYYHWYSTAAQSTSPYDLINQELTSLFDESENNLRENCEKKVLAPIRRSLGGILRK